MGDKVRTFQVVGPYPIVVVRDKEKVDVPGENPEQGTTGGTFTEDEVEPGCNVQLLIDAGLIKVVEDKAPKAKAAGSGSPA